jgi:chemotaxis protein methyltransferase CheR
LERRREAGGLRVIVCGAGEPQRFRGWIARRFGLHFEDAKLEFLAEVLRRRADERGLALQPYIGRLDAPDFAAERQALALELTVPETYFFRHIDQFHAFADVALPSAEAARGATARVNLLSAGCASGEEAYSLAMLVRERGVAGGGNAAIQALDINTAMLAKARRGVYSEWALREAPADAKKRWFRRVGKDFELDESIRTAVTFQEVNLVLENSGLWTLARYDVIFCRNLLMYFTRDSAQSLVARLTRALAPGGHLFLGHAETLRGLSSEYHLCHTHGTFYYQRKYALHEVRRGKGSGMLSGVPVEALAEDAVIELGVIAGSTDVSAQTDSKPGPAWTTTWQETIQKSSDRIQALSERTATASALGAADDSHAAAQTATELPLVLELLKQERFADALDLLARLPADSERDADVLLLRAALLTHSGNLSAALSVCAQLLQRDELNSGAHYLLALCREGIGERQGALDHYRSAIYLDPDFAMPRLHLGLMARRAGDWDNARRELGHALSLLKREDASRLLLFGGGFGREALVALCRAELKSAGGVA